LKANYTQVVTRTNV